MRHLSGPSRLLRAVCPFRSNQVSELPTNISSQVSQKRSTQSATSRRWALERGGILSKPMSGMSGQLTKGTRGPSTGSLPLEPLRRATEIIPQLAVGCLRRGWRMTVGKGEVERRKERRNGDCSDRDDRAPWSRKSDRGPSFSSASLSMHALDWIKRRIYNGLGALGIGRRMSIGQGSTI